MAVPDTRADTADTADTWRTDLWWHRKGFMGARWRWWGSHIVDMTLALTGGRLDFTTVDDLRRAHELLMTANEDVDVVRMSLAPPLADALAVLGSLEAIAEEETGLTLIELREIDHNAAYSPPPAEFPRQVIRVKKAVAKQIFRNPLIEMLELTQVLRQYQAVATMLEDVVWDLAAELRPTRPATVLEHAIGRRYDVDRHIAVHRERRGAPGNPVRIPRQILARPLGTGPVLCAR